ncbi:hypothetical protein [Nonomuraea sp. NPDC003804]|uniref:hypothetical protein n=1 Tax=Nonomuraea sp. NPDC003804 TaxID=3154547 RepID=UPI0033B2B821
MPGANAIMGTVGEFLSWCCLQGWVPAKGGPGESVKTVDIDDRVEICVRKPSRIRVAYTFCDRRKPRHAWYYIPFDRAIPSIGGQAEGGSFRFTTDYATTYRARRKGGQAKDAALDYTPEDLEDEEPEDEEETTTDDPFGTTTTRRPRTTVRIGKRTDRRCR